MMPQKTTLKKWLTISLWSLLGLAGFVLLVAAFNKKNELACTGIDIDITGGNDNFFINKQEIIETISRFEGGVVEGRLVRNFNLDSLESKIKEDPWISKADLYFDNKGLLKVRIEEKNPVARLFCTDGTSCYLDNSKNTLPLSNRHAARLPVFTGFPSSLKVLTSEDSALLEDVRLMSTVISKDDFLMAMIDQVDINTSRQFEMVPKIGDQLIVFGSAEKMEEKFSKLKLFYQKIIPEYGWSKYKKINLDYSNQIVATISGNADVVGDSLKTIQMMDALATYTALKAADTTVTMIQDNSSNSTDPSLINNSIQRDEPSVSDENVPVAPEIKTVVNVKPSPVKTVTVATPPKSKAPVKEPKTTNKIPAPVKAAAVATKAKIEKKPAKPDVKATQKAAPQPAKGTIKKGNDY